MALRMGSSMAMGSIFKLSEAEAVFHPWWATLEDYSQFTIILIGLFAVPTANNKLECAVTQEEDEKSPAPKSFVNGVCTREVLPLFMAYFPYIIVLAPATLVILGKFFSSASYGGGKIGKFYALLIEDSLNQDNLQKVHLENRRDIKEMRNEFRHSKSFVIGYSIRIILELAISVSSQCYILYKGYGNIYECEGISCSYANYKQCAMRGVNHKCIVPHTHYYFYILLLATTLNLIYIISKLWTVAWLIFKRFRKLGSHLIEYKDSVIDYSKAHNWSEEKTKGIVDVYGGLKSPDVELMLDLLAETKGSAPAMRILTLLDREFLKAWKVQQVSQDEAIESATAVLTFEGAKMGRYLGDKAEGKLFYVATISPQMETQDDSSIQTFLHLPENDNDEWEELWEKNPKNSEKEEKERKLKLREMLKSSTYTLRYKDLQAGTDYKVTISTLYNGKEVAEQYLTFTTRPVPPTGLITKWDFDVNESTVFYKAELRWVPISATASYFIEISEGNMSMSSQANEPYFEHFTEGTQEVHVKVWSMINGKWKSSEFLEETLQPVPQTMRDYVSKLTATMPEEVIGSKFMLQVSLLKKISKDLRDLYTQLQAATTVKNTEEGKSKNPGADLRGDDGDDISVTDVFMGKGNFAGANLGANLANLGQSFGLPSI